MLLNLLFVEISIGQSRRISKDEEFQIRNKHAPKHLSLAIGIDKFEDKFWRQLAYAAKDAEAFYSKLKYSVQPKYDYSQLLSSNKEPVNLEDVRKALAQLSIQNNNEDDTVIIYLSTHGTLFQNGIDIEQRLVMADSKHKNMAETSLSLAELQRWYTALKSKRKALILDTCYSGIGRSQLPTELKRQLNHLKGGSFFSKPIYSLGKGTIELSSASWSEPALEDPKLGHGVYTYYLMKGMTKDTNKDGIITLIEAHNYATVKTIRHTKGLQNPTAQAKVIGMDPIVFYRKKGKQRNSTLYSLEKSLRNYYIALNGKYIGLASRGVSIPEGQHELKIVDRKKKKIVYSRNMNFKAGKEYTLSSIMTQERQWRIGMGLATLGYSDNLVKAEHLPTHTQGVLLRLETSKSIDSWFTSFSFMYFPTIRESVEVQLSDSEDVRTVEQERSSLMFELGLGVRKALYKSLYYGFELGAAGQQIKREDQEDLDLFDDVFTGGMYLRPQLEMNSILHSRVSVGFKPNLNISLNPYETGEPAIISFGVMVDAQLSF